jgi:hypothetical protein
MEINDLRPGNWVSYQNLKGYNYKVIKAETTEFGSDVITVKSWYTGENETLLAHAFYPIYIEDRIDIKKGQFNFEDNGFFYDIYEDAYIYTHVIKNVKGSLPVYDFKVFIYLSDHTTDGTVIVHIEKYPDNWNDMSFDEQEEYMEEQGEMYTKNMEYVHELQNFLEDNGINMDIKVKYSVK